MLSLLAAVVVLQAPNTLTAEESRNGWRLLFDGKTTTGWRNFKAKTISDGWVVRDGALVNENVDRAGDIVTTDQFDWFELSLDFKLSKGGNSGVMFHVTELGDATWQSGPEVQLYDHQGVPGAEQTGWLYQLYSSKVDASKPAGEWNTLRLKVTPALCETHVNGQKYYDFVLGSDDFKARLAKSKFGSMPHFAAARKGHIALQGDHGVVWFRNVKLRPLPATR